MTKDNGAVDWAAALAEIEADIARLQATADVIRERIGRSGTSPSSGGGPGGGIKSDAFLKMSISDATKKFLEMTRTKQSTQEVMDALVNGLPKCEPRGIQTEALPGMTYPMGSCSAQVAIGRSRSIEHDVWQCRRGW